MKVFNWKMFLAIATFLMLFSNIDALKNIGDGDNDINEIILEDFANPKNKWKALNDPVMGGRSTSSVKIEDGVAKFNGQVKIVPSLQAPGFITMVTGGYFSKAAQFPDVSMCQAIKLVLRSTKDEKEDDYTGYCLSFGRHRVPGGRFAIGYKAPAWTNVPTGSNFGEIVLPFDTFSAKWDDATGEITVPCSSEHPEYCPDIKSLQNMKTISFWGEGVEGEVALEIKMISAIGCNNGAKVKKKEKENIIISSTIGQKVLDYELMERKENKIMLKPDLGATTAMLHSKKQRHDDESEIFIEDFSDPTNDWISKNDPVMGGRSYSTVVIKDGIAKFEGYVNIVPFLHAPGFVTMVTGDYRGSSTAKFPDVSSCDALKVVVRSTGDDDYSGYRISFGHVHLPDGHDAYGYKAPAWKHVPVKEFGILLFPFHTFSSKWNEATGDIEVPCSSQNSDLCPSNSALQNMQTMSIWGEGVEGKISLEIKSISAVGCNPSSESY